MATGKDRHAMLRRRSAARKKGILWGLDCDTFPNAPGRCPCCGVRMQRGVKGNRRIAPTMERLIPERGYVPGNVLWICWMCNTTKSSHTLAELYRVADFFYDQHRVRGLPCPTPRTEQMNNAPHHADRAHSILGASSARRWMACPGSIALSGTIPDHDTTTFYAAEGTAAHELAELALSGGVDPIMYIGKRIDGIRVSKEMALSVGMYCDKVNALAKASHADPQLEVRFTLDKLNTPVPMFGTADCVVWDAMRDHLHVMDYKHGQGVVIEATENPQLMYYALGAVLELGVKPEKITIWIVQPRAPHRDGVVRDYTFTWERMVEFRHELTTAAARTQEPDADLVVGDWCRFCPAQAICPAQQEYALATVQDAFAVTTEPSLPEPETLSEEELSLVMEHAPLIESWFRAVRKHVQEKLESGGSHGGWKLVAKRANRQWTDEEQAKLALLELGLESDDLLVTKLISPAQADKLLRREGMDIPGGLVHRESSGYNLVPDADPRPAVAPQELAETLFTVETTGD